jgi:hypothetical protein
MQRTVSCRAKPVHGEFLRCLNLMLLAILIHRRRARLPGPFPSFDRELSASLRKTRGGKRQFGEWHGSRYPQVLGIDEHFFTRRSGCAPTLCDLRNHKLYDVVLGRWSFRRSLFPKAGRQGRSARGVHGLGLEPPLSGPPALPQRAQRGRPLPRLINHHLLACWRDIDGVDAKNRGLLSLMRRHRDNLRADQQICLTAYLTEHPVFGLHLSL